MYGNVRISISYSDIYIALRDERWVGPSEKPVSITGRINLRE